MDDEVGEDVAVEAVGFGGVEGAVGEAAGGVDGGEGGEGEVGGYDEGVRREEFRGLLKNGEGDGGEQDAGVEFLDLGEGGLDTLRIR